MASRMIIQVASAPDLRGLLSDSDDSDSMYDNKGRKKKKPRPISRMSANNLDAMRRSYELKAEVESVVPREIVQSLNRLSLYTKSEKVIVKHAPISPRAAGRRQKSETGFFGRLSRRFAEEKHSLGADKFKKPCFIRPASAPPDMVVLNEQTRSPSLVFIDSTPDSPPCTFTLPPCSITTPVEEFSIHYINGASDDDVNSLSPGEESSLPPSPRAVEIGSQILTPKLSEESSSTDPSRSPFKISDVFRFSNTCEGLSSERSFGKERSLGKEPEDSASGLSGSGVFKDKRRTTSLRLQIASDLHMEMFDRDPYTPASVLRQRVIQPLCKFLALVGDIGCPAEEEGYKAYKEFLLHQATQFEKVFVLAGNHEYYNNGLKANQHLSVNQIKQRIQGICDLNERLVFLDRKSVVLNGVRVVGCTLWSAIQSEKRKIVQQSVNDYHLCYVENTPFDPLAFSSSPTSFSCSNPRSQPSAFASCLSPMDPSPSPYPSATSSSSSSSSFSDCMELVYPCSSPCASASCSFVPSSSSSAPSLPPSSSFDLIYPCCSSSCCSSHIAPPSTTASHLQKKQPFTVSPPSSASSPSSSFSRISLPSVKLKQTHSSSSLEHSLISSSSCSTSASSAPLSLPNACAKTVASTFYIPSPLSSSSSPAASSSCPSNSSSSYLHPQSVKLKSPLRPASSSSFSASPSHHSTAESATATTKQCPSSPSSSLTHLHTFPFSSSASSSACSTRTKIPEPFLPPPCLSCSDSSFSAPVACSSLTSPATLGSPSAPRLRRLTTRDTNRWHREEVAFIHTEALEAKRLGQKLLVLTHHPPTFRNTSNPNYADSPIRVAFASDLEYMLDWRGKSDFSAVHTWVSGHTHWSSDQLINGTHVVSNQYGYTGTSECIYKPGFVISV